jgi:hypothetical protein
MSDFKAIATVTAALRTLLIKSNIGTEVTGTQIISRPPTNITVNQNERFLNIYLYYINLNSGFNSYNQPYRSSSGYFIQKPLLALNLHYLLTPYTNDNEIISQQILGYAMRILNEKSVLPRDIIKLAIDGSPPEENLKNSNLADQIESVKFTFHSLSLEEITKLWSSFFHQTGYRTSVSYLATVVLIEGETNVSEQLPVRDRKVQVFPVQKPVLEKVEKENV